MQKIGLLINISGPLLDNRDLFVGTVNETRQRYGYQPKKAGDILYLFEDNPERFKKQLNLDSKDVIETFKEIWDKNVRNSNKIRKTTDGVNLMNELASPRYKDIGIVLFGREPEYEIELYMKNGMIPSRYPVVTGNEVGGKDDSEFLENARKLAGSDYKDTLVVTDSTRMMMKAKEMGMHPIGIEWGWMTPKHKYLFSNGITVARDYNAIIKEIEIVRNRYRKNI
jgi:phosphoglycolate phosphatase-like HAD superfamily hydrolase